MFDMVQSLLPKSPWFGRLDELKALVAQRLSGAEIGRKMGFTRNAVIGKCDREGISLLGPKGAGARADFNKIKRKEKRDYRRETRKRFPIPDFVLRETWVAEPLRVGLLELGPLHCRQVIGETDDNCLPLYCGHPISYRSFCAAHAKINFVWGRR